MPAGKRESAKTVKKRSHGIAARDKILDAAGEIASERGYEGTSISLVSKRSGLPASSIYWHFKDKDDLISAVIERSFNAWLQALIDFGAADEDVSTEEFVAHQVLQSTQGLAAAPDFLRLGLMLGLEQRPEEPTARKVFLNVRSQAFQNAVKTFKARLPDLDRKSLEKLASFTIALADGCFISQQVADKTTDLMAHHELQAAAILGVINHLRSGR
jgi:AcrR family transcriptional regulator